MKAIIQAGLRTQSKLTYKFVGRC